MTWQESFVRGYLPQFADAELAALAAALDARDPRLGQGFVTDPPAGLTTVEGRVTYTNDRFPVERCCPVAYVGHVCRGLSTPGGVREFFDRCVRRAEALLPVDWADAGLFLDYWDDAPADVVYPEVAALCRAELLARSGGSANQPPTGEAVPS